MLTFFIIRGYKEVREIQRLAFFVVCYMKTALPCSQPNSSNLVLYYFVYIIANQTDAIILIVLLVVNEQTSSSCSNPHLSLAVE